MLQRGLIRAWLVPAIIIGIATVLQWLGDDALLVLRYDRAEIASGDFVRLLSGHGVHLGAAHYLMNIAGLGLVWYLVGGSFSQPQWAAIIVTSIVVMDLGFWLLMPDLDWYVGLSGLLHGMLAAGIAGIWRTRKVEAAIIASLMALKLGYEALVGPVPGSAGIAGGDIITEAHLLGSVGGIIAGTLFSIRVRPTAPI